MTEGGGQLCAGLYGDDRVLRLRLHALIERAKLGPGECIKRNNVEFTLIMQFDPTYLCVTRDVKSVCLRVKSQVKI